MNGDEFYARFWITLAYCLCMIFLVVGYVKGYQSWIYYGLTCFVVGLLWNISFKLSLLLNIFHNGVMELVEEDFGDEL